MLDVSPVTLRTWAARYRIAPQGHAPGRHRRYTAEDLRTLRAMRELITAGMPPRDAARLSLAGSAAPAEELPETQAEIADQLADAAESLDQDRLVRLVQVCVRAHGLANAWDTVIAPLVRGYGRRWLQEGDCIDIEHVLADTIVDGVADDLADPVPSVRTEATVLLGCCPGERHALPLWVLKRALRDHGVRSVVLADGVPSAVTISAVDRLQPATVVLWSLVRETADASLLRTLEREGHTVCLAGPGWTSGLRRRRHWVNHLTSAIDLINKLVNAQG